MPDLYRLQVVLQVFRSQTTVPDETVDPEIQESQDIQVQLGDWFGVVKQTIAADAADVTLTLPAPPYDAGLYLDTDWPVEINVNSQGWQVVNKAYISQAPVTTLHVRNLLITPPNTTTVTATVRYFCGKVAS